MGLNILKTLLFICFSFSLFGQVSEPPKLVVGIVVDQMCYDYLYRFQDKYSDRGFVKLMKEGTNCRSTHYNYVPTYTGPGHASIYTGTTPSNHGIVGNQWFVKPKGVSVNCVSDDNVKTVGSSSNKGKCSPHHLLSNTITDQLKLTYKGSKVISISIKDRGAILPGGHLSNGSYWFDKEEGKMITSDFFKNELPSWVNEFNALNYPSNSMSNIWETLYPISTYTESEPDDSKYEILFPGKSKPVFPYDLSVVPEKRKYELFISTPYANTYLTDFAIQSITSEGLGTRKESDFLCVSYSSTDILGHAFGPYSIELEDMYLRLDLELSRLIKTLEEKVGKDNFVLFLTSDHAVVPVPQYLIDKKLPGGYLSLEQKIIELNEVLQVKFGSKFIQSNVNNNIYLDDKTIQLLGLNKEEIVDFIKSEINKWKGVKEVFIYKDLTLDCEKSKWGNMVREGYVRDRSGDLIFILQPGYLTEYSDKSHKGTSHGSAFNYDTHVPLLWYGKGVEEKEVFRKIDITDIAATLTHILNLQTPSSTTGTPILEILEE